MSDIQERLESLTPAQRKLLLKKIRQRAAVPSCETGVDRTTIPQVKRGEQMVLSLAQERLWFIEQLEETRSAYTVATAGYIDGILDSDILHHALVKVVDRHEILRTTFWDLRGKPFQRISPESTVDLRLRDLTTFAQERRNREKDAWLTNLVNEPFDLTTGPLHRFGLVKFGDERYLLAIVMHHIITDGWSLGIFFKDLSNSYNSLAGITARSAIPLAIQYADYADWQRDFERKGGFAHHMEFWKTCLDGAPPLLALPVDAPRQPSTNVNGATGSFIIPSRLTSQLKELALHTQATLFMVTLAGFATLLNRYSRQDDIVIGTPAGNRSIVELEQLIGLFVNSLALRIQFTDDLTVASLINRVRNVVLEAFAHQDAPFEQVVDACVKERSLDHSPIFQVMFAHQNSPMPDSGLGDCLFTPVPVERDSTHFDLGFFLAEKGDQLEVSYEYRTDLFQEETILRLGSYYVNILGGMTGSPDSIVSTIPLCKQGEKNINTTGTDTALYMTESNTSVVKLFEEQCIKDGSRIAIETENRRVSYHKLSCSANMIAARLKDMEVGPDVVVAVALERSVEMIAAVVGILKAGGACLPVDLANPIERSMGIIMDSSAHILVTSRKVESEHGFCTANTAHCPQVIFVDDLADDTMPDENPTSQISPENLSYVLYTSGSTGKPKGVAMPHRPLTNLVLWQLHETGFEHSAVTLQFSPLCFDVSFQEIFCTLCSGGKLVLIDEHTRRDSGALLDVMIRFDVERLFLPFVALQQLAIAAENRSLYPKALREVITAGEQLRITDPVRNFFNQLADCRLHNQYGPTESHVVTSLTLSDDVNSWPLLPSIGRPISNCAIYILEKNMEPAPVGVPGELYIGGQVCARGYLNQPDLTRERFIKDPFSGNIDACMYKSGDLARYMPDGNIECLGRVDHQVKIRGFRVELQEIESVLDCLASVKECAVVVYEHEDSLPELAAYVVTGEQVEMSVLRSNLAEKLPSYMVPRYFVWLETMPLTPNGKIDRQALPCPDPGNQHSAEVSTPCRQTEVILSEIWARVLGLTTIDVNENFFEAGGHSLLATKLISEINELLSLELPIRKIFDYPTIAELADIIDSQDRKDDENFDITSELAKSEGKLSFAQERLWIVEQSIGESAVYNMPVALECLGALDIDTFQQAIDLIIARHETLRTVFLKDEKGVPFIKVVNEIDCKLIHHDLRNVHSADDKNQLIERHIHEEANRPFDLEQGPLFRAAIIFTGDESSFILLTFHHIICDGWSISVFSHELTAIYKDLINGERITISPLSVQYHDFAHWQRCYLAGNKGRALREYWQQQLEGARHQLDIATDYSPSGATTHTGDSVYFTLEPRICTGLNRLSRDKASTLFMTMLTAFSWVIHCCTGQDDFLIGTPIANRNRKRFESLIGFFVNMLPLRITLPGNPDFVDVLNQVRTTCLEAYTHQDMPFDEIVRIVQPDRTLNRHPLIQVVFVLQNTPEPVLKLGETELRSIGRDQTVAKYDLLMSLTQSDGEIHGALEYSTDLFSAATAEGLVELYIRIVTTVLDNPRIRILDPLISGLEAVAEDSAAITDDISFNF